MDFAEKHKDQADQFQVITIHDNTMIQSIDALKPKLEQFKKQIWKGRDLPFPVFFDSTGVTFQRYPGQMYPYAFLVDPQGNLAEMEVGYGKLEKRLAAELQKLPKKTPYGAEKKTDEQPPGTDKGGDAKPKSDTKPADEKPTGHGATGDKPAASQPSGGKSPPAAPPGAAIDKKPDTQPPK